MDEQKVPLVEKELTGRILGAAMKVHNTLGCGLLEKVYENALVIELRKCGLFVDQQAHYDVLYEATKVGEYAPDIVVENRIIVDTKCVRAIGDEEIAKMVHYTRIAAKPVGLVINFYHVKLEWERVINPRHIQ